MGNSNNKQAQEEVIRMRDEFEMSDPAETRKYGKTHFIYIKDNGQKGARLDRFLVTPALNNSITDYTRHGSGGSDHAMIGITVDFSNFQPGKGYWKFPEYLLDDKQYCSAMLTQVFKTVANYKLDDDNIPIAQSSNRKYNNFIRHGKPDKEGVRFCGNLVID